jgi:lysyl-tRNA synthetase class 2
MMELYMAYADYKDLIELTESLFRTLAQDSGHHAGPLR